MSEILRKDMINEVIIMFSGQKAHVNCDRKCSKAWGISNRPKIQFSDDEDDTAFLADYELEEAPEDPGTYEGGQAKPISPNDFPTKWCVRECERCNMSEPGEWMHELEVKSFEKRRYNQPWKHMEENSMTLQQQEKTAREGYPDSDRCPFCQSVDIHCNAMYGDREDFYFYRCQTCHRKFDTPIKG